LDDKKVNVSDKGLTLLKIAESLSLTPYPDAGGYSIGWGHFIKPTEAYLMQGINLATADALLTADVAWAVKAVNRYVTQALIQNQFDALVSLVYNIGETAFRKSTLLKLLNQGKLIACANEFGKWIHSQGIVDPVLVRRRAAEKLLFQTA